MVAVPPPPRLYDLPAFAGLAAVARECKVDFTLFGGTASRIAMHLVWHPGEHPDLFDIAPFASDIDLVHSGKKDRNAEILAVIRRLVPFAGWARWSLISTAEWHEVEDNMRRSLEVPLRRIRIAGARPLPWPEQAAADLLARRVTVRQPLELGGSLARQGRSLASFGWFLALAARDELREIAGAGELADGGGFRWLEGANAKADAAALAESPVLQARYWHMSASRWARSGRVDGLDAWAAPAGGMPVPTPPPFTVSKLTRAGEFRVGQKFPTVVEGEAAVSQALAALARLADRHGGSPPSIDPAFRIVGFVGGLDVKGGAAGLDDAGAFGSLPEGEFLHFSWQPATKLPPTLTAVVLPGDDDMLEPFPPALAVGGVFGNGRAWLRVDIEAQVRAAADRRRAVPIALVILAPAVEL
ncbi:hypothetical protein IP88_05825 [alpha proteobacterium AAP81b]|nr:hypothetical protein IP88_05825 [alpha proteobacterium AAP81b]